MHVCSFTSVVSNFLWPYGLQPARLLCPWGFYRQEYWTRLPCPPPGDLPDWGIKAASPALQADSLTTEPPGKPNLSLYSSQFCKWEQMILMQVRAKNPTRQLAVTHSSNSSQFTEVTLSGKWAYCHFFSRLLQTLQKNLWGSMRLWRISVVTR